jgi:hypothetical protein
MRRINRLLRKLHYLPTLLFSVMQLAIEHPDVVCVRWPIEKPAHDDPSFHDSSRKKSPGQRYLPRRGTLALKNHDAEDAETCYYPKNLAYWVSPPSIAYALGFRKENGGATEQKYQRKTIFD